MPCGKPALTGDPNHSVELGGCDYFVPARPSYDRYIADHGTITKEQREMWAEMPEYKPEDAPGNGSRADSFPGNPVKAPKRPFSF